MLKARVGLFSLAAIAAATLVPAAIAQSSAGWTFAVSGDSRNCGDFVMPAIAAKTKANKDAFYWHLGDLRWMSNVDEDIKAMLPQGQELSIDEYHKMAWDDFLARQVKAFGDEPFFLGRGNHEAVAPMTREGYVQEFKPLLERPEILAQREKDGDAGAPLGPWYHWVEKGVDFITLDNSTKDEFSDAQLRWLRGVLDRDLKAGSGVTTIVMGAHEALPHSTGSDHAMDDWELGQRTGELVYTWFYDAMAAGKKVYLIASHSHYYSPQIYNTPFWKQYSKKVVPGIIVGTSGAHRYALPKKAAKGAKAKVYGYLRGSVQADGSIDWEFVELTEKELMDAKWPEAPEAAIHQCFVGNADED
jgi:hypothetical protein